MSNYFYSLGYLLSQPAWNVPWMGDVSGWRNCLPVLEQLSNEENQ